MNAEYARDIMRESCQPELMAEYSHAARTIQQTIANTVDPFQDDYTADLRLLNLKKANDFAESMDPNRPAVKAAMLDGAISLRGYLYRYRRYPDSMGAYIDIWKNTPLANLAGKCYILNTIWQKKV